LIRGFIIFFFILSRGYAHSYHDERMTYARSVLDKGFKENDSATIAEGYYLLGKREVDKINFAEAYNYFFRALKINEAVRDYYNVGRIYLRLSNLERRSQNYEKSLDYVKDGIRAFSKTTRTEGLASGYIEAGQVFYGFAYQYSSVSPHPAYLDSALSYFHKAEKLFLEANKTKELAKISYQLGQIYTSKKDKKALFYFESALKTNESLQKDSTFFRIQVEIAGAWIALNNPARAKAALTEIEKMTDGFVPPDALEKYHLAYANYFKATNDWQNAMAHMENAMEFRRRRIESNRKDDLNLLRVQLETHQKDTELRVQQERINSKQKLISQQNIYMSVLLLFFILLVLLSYFLYKNYKKQKKLTERNELLIHEQNHRVKNNLQVISSMLNLQSGYIKDMAVQEALSESRTRINSMLLLHKQLYENGNVEFINIRELLTDLSSSIAQSFGVYTLRLNQKMEVENLKTDVATAIGLIFNELITNSFKYAFTDSSSTIEIRSKQEKNGIVTMEYHDFGQKDLTPIIENPKKSTFGLNLIEMILFQIDGKLTYCFQNGSVFTIQFKNI
jgi:two-component sensor histidine kinase